MLVLTRKVGQALRLGDDIRVVVLGVEGGQVRLVIEAPQGVRVRRAEDAAEDAPGNPRET
jgi:carbon storage regulator